VTNNPQLSPVVRDIIADSENTLYLGVASSWEIIIKFKTGKLPLPELPTQFIQSCLSVNCFESLAIDLPHVLSRVTGEMRSHIPKTQTRSGDESSRYQTRRKGETAF
jgi:PIN domain nuclease of toxin-antitoxin system